MRTIFAKRLVKGNPSLDVPYSEVYEAAQNREPYVRIWIEGEWQIGYASPRDLLKNAVVTSDRLTIQEKQLSKDAPPSLSGQDRSETLDILLKRKEVFRRWK